MNAPDRDTLLSTVKPTPPFAWRKYKLTIVGDGYLLDGTRVHMVHESLPSQPIMLSNAWVFSRVGDVPPATKMNG